MNWKSTNIKGYSVSDEGQIKNELTGKVLSQFKNNMGYYLVSIQDKKYLVHRLVAEAFLNKPNKCNIVEHKDDDPTNNCVDNLMWSTQKLNLNRQGRLEKLKRYYQSNEWKEARKKALETMKANGFKKTKSDKQKAKEAARLDRISKERENIRPTLDQQYDAFINPLIDLLKSGYSLKRAAQYFGINDTTGITYFSKRYYEETGIKLITYKIKKSSFSNAEKLMNKIKELYNQGLTVEEISEEVNRSINIVNKYIKLWKIHI